MPSLFIHNYPEYKYLFNRARLPLRFRSEIPRSEPKWRFSLGMTDAFLPLPFPFVNGIPFR